MENSAKEIDHNNLIGNIKTQMKLRQISVKINSVSPLE